MQVEVPQILWHSDSRQIMSIDFYPNSNYLVTSSVISEEDTGIRVSDKSDSRLLSIKNFQNRLCLTHSLLFVVLGASARLIARRVGKMDARISLRFAKWTHLNSECGQIFTKWIIPGHRLRRLDGRCMVSKASPS